MKRINIALFTLMILAFFFACKRTKLSTTSTGGLWVGRASLPSIGAFGAAASFTVDNLAYVGTGLNPLAPLQKLTTLFQYTPAVIAANMPYGYDSAYGYWTQMKDFPGQARSNAVGFNIGNTGYLGSGLANDGKTALADFYAYNPAANTWSPIDSIHAENASFPRYDAVAFSFDTTAYVLTGTDGNNYFGDVWRYSPTANTWIQQIYYPGSPRSGAVSFVYHGQGFLVTGFTPGAIWAQGNLCYDFWRFTPQSDSSVISWARLKDIYNGYTDIIRNHANSFQILGQPNGDKAYITLGANNGTDINSTWEYDFASDQWTSKTAFSGTSRTGAVSFTLNTVPAIAGEVSTRGFVATGLNQGNSSAFADCYEFFPIK
jgi:N-acetylneuraminic acid mutarotase